MLHAERKYMTRWIRWTTTTILAAGLAVQLSDGAVARAQYGGRYDRGYRQTQPYNDHYDRGRYGDRGDYDRHHGGIGPGKGALIGGGAGALLGGLLGGGLKGALIGGGIGAGGGALLGKAHQNSQRRRDYRDRYDRYGNRY